MVDKDAVRRGYDDLAETYAAERSADGTGTDVLRRFLESVPASARLLDAGCGQGTPVLRERGADGSPVGVDFSREQLRLAAATAPDAALAQGDVMRLPFADDAFDVVTAYHSLIHVPLEEHQTVVDEFARVLRPGGRVLLTEGTAEWQGTNPDWLETGVEMQWHVAGPEATREHLRTAGFAIEDERGASVTLAEEERWRYFTATLEA